MFLRSTQQEKSFATRIHTTGNVPCLQARYDFEVIVFTEINLVGESLSEPHTSMILWTCACVCLPCLLACLLGLITYLKSLPALILRGLCHTLNSKTTR